MTKRDFSLDAQPKAIIFVVSCWPLAGACEVVVSGALLRGEASFVPSFFSLIR